MMVRGASFIDDDGDDDLDLLIQGQGTFHSSTYTKLFENDGSGNFSEVEDSPFSAVFLGCLAFSDVDGDNDLDVLISGTSAWPDETKSTKLYFNDGSGNFTEQNNSPFISVTGGSVAFADVDNDSDLDLFLTGSNQGLPFPDRHNAILYFNQSQSIPDSTALEEDPLPGFIVYPNPAKSSGQINIGYDYHLTGTIEFSILDSDGRFILKGNSRLERGNNNTQINLTSLKEGHYYLKVQHCQDQKVFQLIVE